MCCGRNRIGGFVAVEVVENRKMRFVGEGTQVGRGLGHAHMTLFRKGGAGVDTYIEKLN